MPRRMRLREGDREGRATALRRLTFVVADDGGVSVLDEGAVVDRYRNLARALTSYRLRRSELVVLEE